MKAHAEYEDVRELLRKVTTENNTLRQENEQLRTKNTQDGNKLRRLECLMASNVSYRVAKGKLLETQKCTERRRGTRASRRFACRSLPPSKRTELHSWMCPRPRTPTIKALPTTVQLTGDITTTKPSPPFGVYS